MDQQQLPPGTNNGRGSFSTLLLITFMIFMLSGGSDDVGQRLEIESTMTRMRYRISNYSAWLNHTESNFSQTIEPTAIPPLIQTILPHYPPLDVETSSYYSNITGFLSGGVKVHNLSTPISGLRKEWIPYIESFAQGLNHSDAAERTAPWRNWNLASKTLSNVREYPVKHLKQGAFLTGSMDLTAPDDDNALKLDFEGVHFNETGVFVAMLGPFGKHIDIRQLSAHVPEPFRNVTAHAVEEELKSRLEKYEKLYMSGSISDGESASTAEGPHCSFLMFAQLRPSPLSVSNMLEYERELAHPSGANIPHPPVPQFDGVLVSSDCALLIEMRDVEALQADVFWRKATTYASIAFIIYLMMLALTVNQMEWTSNPASISKLSRWTFAIQAIIDSYAFVTHITVGVVSNNRSSGSLIAPGFLAASLCLVFEVRYAILMHRIQAPEDAAARPQAPPPPPTPAASAASAALRRAATTTDADDLESQQPIPTAPPPIRAPAAPATPERSTIQDIIATVSNPESKTWVFAAFVLISMFQVFMSSSFLIPSLLALHSFWLPQILRNVKKGSRKALRKRYVIGVTVCRSYFLLYALACPKNVLFNEPNKGVWLILGWLVLQVGFLVAQEHLGSAFFLPKTWEHKKLYDYHVTVPVPDAEAPDESLGDCSVCLEPILSPRPDLSGLGPSEKEAVALLHSVSETRSYCLAPCSHKFHSGCLERWLTIKTICPVCRRPLPPL